MTDLLTKQFDAATVEKLKHADKLCQGLAEQFREYRLKKSLANEPLDLDEQDYELIVIIGAYGVLYNYAVEAGLVEDVLHVEASPDRR